MNRAFSSFRILKMSKEELTNSPEIIIPHEFAVGFAGQGATTTLAGVDWYEASEASREIFERSHDHLRDVIGFSFMDLWRNGSDMDAKNNLNVHLLNTVVMSATYAGMREKWPDERPKYFLPQSSGGIPAAIASGVVSLKDGLNIAIERARLTDSVGEKTPGQMYFLSGLTMPIEELEHLCELVSDQTGESVEVSNENSPTFTIISGQLGAVETLLARLKGHMKNPIDLKIPIPSHNKKLMGPIVEPLRRFTSDIPRNDPESPWIDGADVLVTGDEVMNSIAENPAKRVRYRQALELLLRKGIPAFLEPSPNRQHREVTARYANDIARKNGILNFKTAMITPTLKFTA